MINQIYREIYVTREALKDPIFYVRGTNAIPIVLRIMDFNIPQGAQVNYYVRKPSGKSTFNAASQVSNTVTIDVKTQDFAETGFCRLQLQVISGDEVLVSFDHPVVVKENYTDSQGDESKNESNVYVMKNQGVVNSGKILGINGKGYVTPMDYEGGGGGGTNNYNNLSNRPQINGVTLSGNKTADELELLPKNVGSQNNGKYLRVNESGDIVPSDSPGSGDTLTALLLDRADGERIPASSDIDTYVDPGNYYSASAADSATMQHTPYTEYGFQLFVFLQNVNVKQIALPTTLDEIKMRTRVGSGEWTSWKYPQGSGGSYTLPIMTETQLGGGKAVAKTTESVPVAVDSSGKLWVPEQNGGSQQDPDYSGKTIVMFGDSIVAGWGWQEGTGITEPLKEKYPNGTWTNQAVSGSNMANKSGSGHPSIVSKVLAYTGAANGILLEGGTNDVNGAVPIGEITSGYDDAFDESTFTGALESALHTIMDRYPLAYKFFLIPHSFGKDNSYTDTFHDRAIEVCEKWNMPVLDMRKRLQIAMTAQNKAIYTRNPNTDQGDGVHPTEELYRTFYSPLVDQFFRSLGILDDMGGSDPEPPENVPVTGVTLDQSAITLTAAGQTQQLRATVQPSNATNKSVTWQSNHPEYATVTQAGLVQAVANGTAVITVKTQDGNKTAQCSVNVDIDESITHQELPSIVFDNNCYFDIGIYPDVTANIELKVHVTDPDVSGTWVAGARDTNNKYTLSITDNWYVTRGSASSEAKKTAFWETDWTIIQDGADFTLNETTVSCDAISDLTINANYYIGNCNNNGEPYTGKGFNGTFYYAKIKSNQELVMDLIPVKKSDGTLCLYDKIGQKYLYNLGSGNLSE